MGEHSTHRDRIWRAALDATEHSNTTIAKVHRDLRLEDGPDPAVETVRRTMNAMVEQGVLAHRDGSPYWNRGPEYS